MTCLIPRHEPETVVAAARRRGGDPTRVPTTAMRAVDHRGVYLTSRYRHADDLELMAQAVDTLSTPAVLMLGAIDCDSAWRSFEVRAHCGLEGLRMIGGELSTAFRTLSNGHGDITLRGIGMAELSMDPQWSHTDL